MSLRSAREFVEKNCFIYINGIKCTYRPDNFDEMVALVEARDKEWRDYIRFGGETDLDFKWALIAIEDALLEHHSSAENIMNVVRHLQYRIFKLSESTPLPSNEDVDGGVGGSTSDFAIGKPVNPLSSVCKCGHPNVLHVNGGVCIQLVTNEKFCSCRLFEGVVRS